MTTELLTLKIGCGHEIVNPLVNKLDILITKNSSDASDKVKHALSPKLFKSSDSNCGID